MKHISILPIMSASGELGHPTVCVAAKTVDTAWAVLWPEADVYPTPKGSFTAEIFTEALAKYVQQKRNAGETRPYVLILDSGGGSLIHLCPRFSLVCMKLDVYPFYTYPNCTAVLMALDQAPNRRAEELFNQAKVDNPDGSGFSTRTGLTAVRDLWSFAYSRSKLLSAAREVGVEANKPLNPDAVLKDKASYLKSFSKKSDLDMVSAEAKVLLETPSSFKRKRAMVACTHCSSRISAGQTHCDNPKCFKENVLFDRDVAIAEGREKLPRKKQALETPASDGILCSIPEEEAAPVLKFHGDLQHQIKAHAGKTDVPTASGGTAKPAAIGMPESVAAETGGAVQSPTVHVSGEQSEVDKDADADDCDESSGDEWDLNDFEDAASAIRDRFDQADLTRLGGTLEEFSRVLDFYLKGHVESRRKSQKTTRAAVLTSELFDPHTGELADRRKRRKWFADFRNLRAKNFVPKKKKL